MYSVSPKQIAKLFLKSHTRSDGRSVYKHTKNVVKLTTKIINQICEIVPMSNVQKDILLKDCVSVAWLHDVVERESKAKVHIPLQYKHQVMLLTKSDDDVRDVYIKATTTDIVTLIVKLADVQDGLQHTTSSKKANRLKKELIFLKKKLDKMIKNTYYTPIDSDVAVKTPK